MRAVRYSKGRELVFALQNVTTGCACEFARNCWTAPGSHQYESEYWFDSGLCKPTYGTDVLRHHIWNMSVVDLDSITVFQGLNSTSP